MKKARMCQHCGNAPATVFLRRDENGRVTEEHLCERCADTLDIWNRWEQQWKACLTEFWKPYALQETAEAVPYRGETHLVETVDKVLQAKRERNALEYALRQAVQAEEYEKAADLRDRLRALQNRP